MLKSKALKIGKKSLLNKILGFFYKLFKNNKTIIVLEACTPFHLEHFKSVILTLSSQNNVSIVIITPDSKGLIGLNNVCFYPTITHYPLYKKADIFISTELHSIPYWFDCPAVYFGHGMGAKLDYVANKGLLEFDYVYSPCRPTYEIQIQSLPQEKVFPVGLPILDDTSSRQQEISDYYHFDNNKPLIVYAPSWCNDITKVSDIKAILAFLNAKKQFNVIVSPHPLLFEPDRCDGQIFFAKNTTFTDIHINSPTSPFTTLDLVKASDIVISDISSILFEAMALKKNVLFDGNKILYEHSNALTIYQEVVQICHTPCWDDFDDLTIEQSIKLDTLSKKRELFINNYLFNNGNASEIFIQKIDEIIKHG